MWFIPILVCLLVLIIFWVILSFIYEKNFGAEPWKVDIALGLDIGYREFNFSRNFIIFKYRLIVKFIVFFICSIITHIFDNVTFAQIVMTILLAKQIAAIYKRTKEYKEQLFVVAKNIFLPVYKGHIIVAVYQVVVVASVYVVYALNVY